MKPVLEANNIRKVYGTRSNFYTAINDISLQVERGEFVSVMGPSGAGKTTLLNVLSSIDKPTSGEVKISGTNLFKMKSRELAVFRRDRLGFIFQDYNLIETMSLKDNITLPLSLSKISSQETEERFQHIAKQFGIYDVRGKYPNEVSGGQKQRTSACRALITNPDLIFADEPTGALDSKAATNLLANLERVRTEEKATILMVTHDAFAASYSNRILFIKDGEIYQELVKGNLTRKQFFQEILAVLAELGGETDARD
ncbi:ABC transporter ATP-binding protein [Listeria kieliensis]|uniref:Bacitracin ABC transporter ATP-binding protein n=1 Tax=Listeria kieliensis TaxID=1621700 RepID=A0A3D8TKH2_9LIST|nr:ABC transporter ATP-binding protein [Listeria kieliensis]RDW99140.1 bacitracin ABC transporter ATP-binding protein [Listeria kieliensis]